LVKLQVILLCLALLIQPAEATGVANKPGNGGALITLVTINLRRNWRQITAVVQEMARKSWDVVLIQEVGLFHSDMVQRITMDLAKASKVTAKWNLWTETEERERKMKHIHKTAQCRFSTQEEVDKYIQKKEGRIQTKQNSGLTILVRDEVAHRVKEIEVFKDRQQIRRNQRLQQLIINSRSFEMRGRK